MTKSVTITKLHPTSWGKLVGTIQATFGLIGGLGITISVMTGAANEQDGLLNALGLSASVAIFAVILLPLILFVVGWLQGVITAWFLNIILSETGGIGIEIKE